MDLKQYIQSKPGNGMALAKALGIPASFLSQLASGTRSVTPRRAMQIEVATGGAVTRRDLLPDDWRAIWPELSDWDGTERRAEPCTKAGCKKSS
jgi:DNA-binding transcriptional regulator YdaS (Cro superfamily)